MLENRLTEEEVKDRLELCTGKPQMLDEVYTFGQMLVRQVVDDLEHVDSKAASIAAYAGAVVTLLVSSGIWRSQAETSMIKYGAMIAGVTAALSVIWAVRARTLEHLDWFSQSDWLRKECLQGSDTFLLKQFRVLTMWGVIGSYRDRHVRKVKLIEVAQRLLAASIFTLALALYGLLLQAAWKCNLYDAFWHGR
jgi:hypothetical protein